MFLAIAVALFCVAAACSTPLVISPVVPRQPIQVDAAAAAQRLAQAIRLRTVSQQSVDLADADAFLALHDLFEQRFPLVHAALRREVVAGHSLLYTWEGTTTAAPVLLAAHLDVVPVASQDWSQPPFAGTIDDGFVWGRGTLDDKGSAMSILEAVEHLLRRGFRPSRRIYLAFGHDEENRGLGALAIANLLAERDQRLSFVLDEGGFVVNGVIDGVDKPMAAVGLAEKGYLTVELLTQCSGGHSSVPPRTTAAGRIARAVSRLEEHPMVGRLGPLTLMQLRALAPEMGWSQRLALANPWLFGGVIERALDSSPMTAATIRTTTAVTVISSGVKGNVLPRQAKAIVNFRILPGDSVASVLAHVHETIDDAEVTVRVLGEPTEPSPVSNAEGEGYRLIGEAIAEVFPDAILTPGLVLGMTDSRRYQQIADGIYRFLPIRMGRSDLDRMHGTDERIAIDDYANMIRFYVRLLERLA